MPTIEISDELMGAIESIVSLENLFRDEFDESGQKMDEQSLVAFLIYKEIKLLGGEETLRFVRDAILDPGTSNFINREFGGYLKALFREAAGAQ